MPVDQQESFRTIEQRALEREIDRLRHELELTEQRTVQLEHRVMIIAGRLERQTFEIF